MKFNQSTSVTRLIAIVLFVGIVPALAFHIGSVYNETVNVVSTYGLASL
jgi:FlaG/FlaF family flagellin (archaellin)